MKLGGSRTVMNSHQRIYISFLAFIRDWSEDELGPRQVTFVPDLSSYCSRVNGNKSQIGSRNFKPTCFWVVRFCSFLALMALLLQKTLVNKKYKVVSIVCY